MSHVRKNIELLWAKHFESQTAPMIINQTFIDIFY